MVDKSTHWIRITNLASGATDERGPLIDVDLKKRHTGKATGTITLPQDTSLNSVVKGLQRIDVYYGDPAAGGVHRFRGKVLKPTHRFDRREGPVTELKVDGVAKDLEEAGAERTFTDTPTHEAKATYINEETSFTATVVEPEPTTILTKDTLDEADTDAELSDIYSPAATEPVQIANGKLELLPSAGWSILTGSTFTGSQYTDGSAEAFQKGGQAFAGTPSLGYEIPADEWTLYVRTRDPNNTGQGAGVEVDNTLIGSISAQDGWQTAGSGSFALSDGSAGIEFFDDGGAGSEEFAIDACVLEDTRYSHGPLDDTTDSNKQLATPRTHAPLTITSSTITAPSGIDKGYLDVQINDTSNGQRLQLSFDGGSTWVPSDGTEQNTDSVTATPSADTRSLQVRVTLDATDDTRTSATPTEGYNGQAIDVQTISADLNDLSVVDSLTVEGSHMDNLQRLAEYGQLRFIPIHDPDAKEIVILPFDPDNTGAQKDVAWRRLETPPETIPGTFYANRVEVKGKRDSNGDRPVGVAKDDAEITADGQTITLDGGIIDPTIESEAGARAKAISLLGRALLRKEPRPEGLEVVAQDIDPGWFYAVDLEDGSTDYVPVESVQLTESEDEAVTELSFSGVEGLADYLRQTRGDVGGVQDQI